MEKSRLQKQFPVQELSLYFCMMLLFFSFSLISGISAPVRIVFMQLLLLAPLFLFRVLQPQEKVSVGFSFWRLSGIDILLVCLLAITVAPFVSMVGEIVASQFPGYAQYKINMVKIITGQLSGLGIIGALVLFALLPAICEELFFRGYLLSGFKRSGVSVGLTIVSVGFLFGLMHLDIYRLVPVTLLGCLMAYVTIATGSIFAGILFHLVNNSLVLLVAHMTADKAPVVKGYQPELLNLVGVAVALMLSFLLMRYLARER